MGFVTVASPIQGWVFLALCIILFMNVAWTGAMVALEDRLGGNVLPVAYFSRHDMIKASASVYLVYCPLLLSYFTQLSFQKWQKYPCLLIFTLAWLYSF